MRVFDFTLEVGKLKQIKRSGWIRENIPNPESVAEHSYRMSVLTMILAPQVGADVNKSVKMALIHDIGEAEIGDIITSRRGKALPNTRKKIASERAALVSIFSLLGNNTYVELFDEFEENLTKEAQLVKQIDKLEMAIQAFEYEQQHKVNLEEFIEEARIKMISRELKQIMDDILLLRKNNGNHDQ